MITRRTLMTSAAAAAALSSVPPVFAGEAFPMQEFLKDLGELVAIDSKSGYAAGVTAVGDVLEKRFATIGWVAERREVGKLGKALALMNKPGLKEFDIILCGHLDTVQPVGNAAKYPLKVEGDFAHGAGVADNKGQCNALWYIFKTLPKTVTDKLNICVLFGPSEEDGPKEHVDYLMQYAKRSPLAFVYEPGRPEDAFVKVRKGCTYLKVTFKGVAAHAGNNPQDGRNAIDSMASAIPQIKALAGNYQGVTINSGVTKGGTTPNTVAAECEITFDLRYMNNADRDDLISRIKALCDKGFTEGVKAEVSSPYLGSAMGLTPQSEKLIGLVKEAEKALGQKERDWLVVGGASDGNDFSNAGVAVVDAMGVCGGNLHNPEKEFLDLRTVPSRIALVQKCLELLAAKKA
jgi:glutamate carboxypeptidase